MKKIQPFTSPRRNILANASGFALPAAVIGVAGILVLTGALITIVSLERDTSRAYRNSYGAEQAVRSGFAEASAILQHLTESDTYQIIQSPLEVPYDDDGDESFDALESDSKRNYLFLVQGEKQGSGVEYNYHPLYSTESKVPSSSKFEAPETTGVSEDDEERTVIHGAERHRLGPVVNWRILRDSEGKAVSRYAYYIEDLQGRLDTNLAGGNEENNNKHARVNETWPEWKSDWPALPEGYEKDDKKFVPLWPAPGLNPSWRPGSKTESLLNQVALFTLDPKGENGPIDTTQFDNDLREYGKHAPSTASLISFYGISPSQLQERETDGENQLSLKDETARAIEENLIAGNRSWREEALIPYVDGIDGSMMGKPKINLNAMLAKNEDSAVTEIATQIGNALPDFANNRKGGFPEDYNKTLAASIIDYADTDSNPTVEEGEYRGIDSYPLINEYALTLSYEWTAEPDGQTENPNYEGKSYVVEGGNTYIFITATVYAELWNMSNHKISGTAKFNFDCQYNVRTPSSPGDPLDSDAMLGQASHDLTKDDREDQWYFKEISFEGAHALEPNSYTFVRVGAVRYKLLYNSEGEEPDGLESIDGDDGMSTYRLKWKGENSTRAAQLCDRANGNIERDIINNFDLNDHRTRANVCGTYGFYQSYYTSMGDLRNTYWAREVVSSSRYPDGFSPGRRNVRHHLYIDTRRHGPKKRYTRVIPCEWSDGGHDSTFENSTFHKQTSSNNRPPDHPDIYTKPVPEAEGKKGSSFISNIGKYFSETELGNIYDPMMWRTNRRVGISTEHWAEKIDESVINARAVGGGNTLRIGRPEHERFFDAKSPESNNETHAYQLLNLFHCGIPLSDDANEREGDKVAIEGHININTASKEVLRSLAAGWMYSDPEIQPYFYDPDRNGAYDRNNTMTLRTRGLLDETSLDKDKFPIYSGIADAIIAGRPYASRSQLATIREDSDNDGKADGSKAILGNPDYVASLLVAGSIPNKWSIQWNDRAAEELFARVYNSSTVRSRNFRIHVIGQSIRELPNGKIEKISERKKSFRVFVGSEDGEEEHSLKIIDETNI